MANKARWVTDEEWAARLRRLLEERGWTFREAASQLHVVPSTLSYIASGRFTPSVHLRHAIRLAEARQPIPLRTVEPAPPPLPLQPELRVSFDTRDDCYHCVVDLVVLEQLITSGRGVGRTRELAYWSALRELPPELLARARAPFTD